ncbi:MAG: peptidoglycan editing factor PgeF [Vicinamibacteria bacterium]
MKFLTSARLAEIPGLHHGFGLRYPGARTAAHSAAQAAFSQAGEVFFLRQAHGCSVATPPWTEPPEADAAITSRAAELLAIETADCLPVLVVDPIHRRVAAAHAGWRGTAARVAEAAVHRLVEAGSKPADLLAALGPAIGPCCYEVGPDVEQAMGVRGEPFFVPGPGDRKHLDVAAANRAQLEECGVRPERIDRVNLCTRCRQDLFFSYRRDGASAGRMISVIGFRPPSSS